MELNLSDSIEIRNGLSKEQAKAISDLYKEIANQIRKKQNALKGQSGASVALQMAQLNDLQKFLEEELRTIQVYLEKSIIEAMTETAEAVVKDNQTWANFLGIQAKLAHVPTDAVNSILTGQVYEGNWSLSESLWKDYKNKKGDIANIIAQGLAQNKSAYDIAKDLEQYVDPNATKPWNWGNVYPGTAKTIDYNAQRLARTMISHAYQQSLILSCKHNPFVSGFRWDASNSERTCQLCLDRDGVIFKKDELPLDHPNGMCTYEAVIEYSMTEIADRLADWVQGNEDPELDEYAESLGFKI